MKNRITPWILSLAVWSTSGAWGQETDVSGLVAIEEILPEMLADAPADQTDPLAPVFVADAVVQRVDILVVHTPAARVYAGSAAAMKAAINTYVAATNTAYKNSDVAVVLKLTAAVEVSYSETGSFSTDLSNLAGTSDAYLTTVQSLRNTYGADLVCLIRRDGAAGVAGIGYLGSLNSSFASYAYSVVGDVWAVGNNSFPHELGHNFGCHHDHNNGSGAPRAYAYGHRFTGTNNVQYRTIMAYAPGSRISYFSNPSITYQGRAIGVAGTGATAADNARLIEESAVVTSAFRAVPTRPGSRVRGDFDGDGQADLVFHNATTNQAVVWIMSGTYKASSTTLGTAAANWRLVAVGDLNGDGHSDLVWEYTDGTRAVWFMNGTTRTGGGSLLATTTDWKIVAAGDFNSDGKADLVFENATSRTWVVWYMNGTTRTGVATLTAAGTNWHLAAAGDLNNDGRTDLLWENTSDGSRAVWYMNGTTRTSAALLPSAGVAWALRATGDFNGDARTDIVFENTSDGTRSVWYMNGSSRLSGATISTLGAAWRIASH